MIEIKHLSKTFQMKDGAVNALKNIDQMCIRDSLTLLHDHAAVQNGDGVADLFHDAHLVGDDHHGDAQLLVDVLDEGQDCLLYTSRCV